MQFRVISLLLNLITVERVLKKYSNNHKWEGTKPLKIHRFIKIMSKLLLITAITASFCPTTQLYLGAGI